MLCTIEIFNAFFEIYKLDLKVKLLEIEEGKSHLSDAFSRRFLRGSNSHTIPPI